MLYLPLAHTRKITEPTLKQNNACAQKSDEVSYDRVLLLLWKRKTFKRSELDRIMHCEGRSNNQVVAGTRSCMAWDTRKMADSVETHRLEGWRNWR